MHLQLFIYANPLFLCKVMIFASIGCIDLESACPGVCLLSKFSQLVLKIIFFVLSTALLTISLIVEKKVAKSATCTNIKTALTQGSQ